jgi:hypothetical protein
MLMRVVMYPALSGRVVAGRRRPSGSVWVPRAIEPSLLGSRCRAPGSGDDGIDDGGGRSRVEGALPVGLLAAVVEAPIPCLDRRSVETEDAARRSALPGGPDHLIESVRGGVLAHGRDSRPAVIPPS